MSDKWTAGSAGLDDLDWMGSNTLTDAYFLPDNGTQVSTLTTHSNPITIYLNLTIYYFIQCPH